MLSVLADGWPIRNSALTKIIGLFRHTIGEFSNGNRFGNDNIARLFGCAWRLPPPCRRFSFSRARFSAASERARAPSSPSSARVTVSLPDWRRSSAAPRVGRCGAFLASSRSRSGRFGASTGVKRRGAGAAPSLLASSATGSNVSGSTGAAAAGGWRRRGGGFFAIGLARVASRLRCAVHAVRLRGGCFLQAPTRRASSASRSNFA